MTDTMEIKGNSCKEDWWKVQMLWGKVRVAICMWQLVLHCMPRPTSGLRDAQDGAPGSASLCGWIPPTCCGMLNYPLWVYFQQWGRPCLLEVKLNCTCLGYWSGSKWLLGIYVQQSLTITVPRHLGREDGEKRMGQMLQSLSRIWPLGMQGFHACSVLSFILQQDVGNNRGFLSLWPIYEPDSPNVLVFLGEVAANFFFTC